MTTNYLIIFRLVFTSVGVGVEIISAKRYDLVKIKPTEHSSDSVYESQAERKHSEGVRTSTVIGLFFLLCLRFRQSGFHLIISNRVGPEENENVLILPTPIQSDL